VHISVTSCVISSVIAMLTACSGNLHPVVTATQSGNSIIISGSGFTNSDPCAHLAVTGAATGSLSLGDVHCGHGAFKDYTWSPNYVIGCNPSTPVSVDVSGVDIKTGTPTFATSSILWGDNCAYVGTCGKIGQRQCPDPANACYLSGGPDSSSGQCVACGHQNQPLCGRAPACLAGLNPNLQGGQTVCSAYCGWTQGAQAPCKALGSPDCQGAPPVLTQPFTPCVTAETVNGKRISVYSCYGDGVANSKIGGSTCVCVANSTNSCRGDTSGSTGLCVHAKDTGC
jgi:hypothetical protein